MSKKEKGLMDMDNSVVIGVAVGEKGIRGLNVSGRKHNKDYIFFKKRKFITKK